MDRAGQLFRSSRAGPEPDLAPVLVDRHEADLRVGPIPVAVDPVTRRERADAAPAALLTRPAPGASRAARRQSGGELRGRRTVEDRAYRLCVGGAVRIAGHQFDRTRSGDPESQLNRPGDLLLVEDRAAADLRRRAKVPQ